MEKAFENTKIAAKYHLSLMSFFKNEFKYHNDSYLIPFSHIQYTRRQIFDYICDVVVIEFVQNYKCATDINLCILLNLFMNSIVIVSQKERFISSTLFLPNLNLDLIVK